MIGEVGTSSNFLAKAKSQKSSRAPCNLQNFTKQFTKLACLEITFVHGY